MIGEKFFISQEYELTTIIACIDVDSLEIENINTILSAIFIEKDGFYKVMLIAIVEKFFQQIELMIDILNTHIRYIEKINTGIRDLRVEFNDMLKHCLTIEGLS